MYQYIMFDLDGTIVESDKGVISSVLFALEELGITVDENQDMKKFLGPPLFYSFTTFLGLDENTTEKAIALYRKHYEAKGHLESPVYQGVEDTLKELKERGKTLLVVTSKPLNMARKIIKNIGLIEYFVDIIGPTPEEKTIEKDEMIRRAFKRHGITSGREAVMIGDRQFDIWAAKKNKVDCIAVLYGYGNREEFEREGADFIVKNCEDVLNIIS